MIFYREISYKYTSLFFGLDANTEGPPTRAYSGRKDAEEDHIELHITCLLFGKIMITQEQIQNLTDDIVRNFNPEKIILFGSHAYGVPKDWSDADLLVIMQFEGNPLQKMSDIVYKVSPRIPVDLLVRTPEMIEKRIKLGDPFMKEITSNGKVLYQRSDA
jgi:uncharacterized protein